MEKSFELYKKDYKKMRKEASLSIIEDVKNNKFLMIRHQRGINKGYINFPGGKKEENMRKQMGGMKNQAEIHSSHRVCMS